MKYLYAAYLITWVILIGYIGMLTLGFRRLQDDVRDLER